MRSFVDVLFILLLATLVMLTQSVRVGAVDTDLLRLGAGGSSPLHGSALRVVIVDDESVLLDGVSHADVATLADRLEDGDAVILVGRTTDVRHHRVMSVWSSIRERGFDVTLGAEPAGGW